MGTRFEAYVDEVEAGASPARRAELDAFRSHHRLAAQFRERRRALGLTQVELAARMGVDQAEVSRLERGVGNPTQQTLLRAATALGVSLTLASDGGGLTRGGSSSGARA
jgi:ribosome-binding protein aMBF1 (putative translation factor)